jgi:hypothetical protein
MVLIYPRFVHSALSMWQLYKRSVITQCKSFYLMINCILISPLESPIFLLLFIMGLIKIKMIKTKTYYGSTDSNILIKERELPEFPLMSNQ